MDGMAALEANDKSVRMEEVVSQKAVRTSQPTVARNAPCPCGSGEKYKRCCGKGAPPQIHLPREVAC
jgi:uncharacterized protein YecA (UPF0149 family)